MAGTDSNRRVGDGEFSAGSKKHSVRCHQLTYFSAASKKYLVRCHQLTSSSCDRRWKEAEVVVRFFNSNENASLAVTYLVPQAKLWSKRQTRHVMATKGRCGVLRCRVEMPRKWKRGPKVDDMTVGAS